MTRRRQIHERMATNRASRFMRRGATRKIRVVGGKRHRVLGKWAQFYDDLYAGRVASSPVIWQVDFDDDCHSWGTSWDIRCIEGPTCR